MENYKIRIAEECKVIDDNLQELFVRFGKSQDQDIQERIVKILEEYVLRGGKRIRGFLVLQSYDLFGGKDREQAIRLACAVELIHAFLLIHDDIMDASETRRGKKTLHRILDDLYHSHGINLGLVFGDTLLFYAYSLIDEKKVLDIVNEVILDTCFGQTMEYIHNIEENIDESKILDIYEMKTSRYSIFMPLIAGATLAGESRFDVLKEYAIPLGISFQIQDDLLDYSENSGKDRFRDIQEGKMTLVLNYALDHCDRDQREFIDLIFGEKVDDEKGEKLRCILEKTGAIDYCNEKIKMLADQSRVSVMDSNLDEAQKQFLLDFVDFLLKRKI